MKILKNGMALLAEVFILCPLIYLQLLPVPDFQEMKDYLILV